MVLWDLHLHLVLVLLENHCHLVVPFDHLIQGLLVGLVGLLGHHHLPDQDLHHRLLVPFLQLVRVDQHFLLVLHFQYLLVLQWVLLFQADPADLVDQVVPQHHLFLELQFGHHVQDYHLCLGFQEVQLVPVSLAVLGGLGFLLIQLLLWDLLLLVDHYHLGGLAVH